MSSQYHQFISSTDPIDTVGNHHHFLTAEPIFPLQQLNVSKSQRTTTCWFDSFLFFISRNIHGDFFRKWMRKIFNKETAYKRLGEEEYGVYEALIDYLEESKIGMSDIPRLNNDQELAVRYCAVEQLVGSANIKNIWENGHALYEPFRTAMTDWTEDTIWFAPEFYVDHPARPDANWGWPLIDTPDENTELNIDYLIEKEIQLFIPVTEYIAINILRSGAGTFTLKDLNEYELVTLFPWDAKHVTCINKTFDGKWECYDNEMKGEYFTIENYAITSDDGKMLGLSDDDICQFDIKRKSVFVIYKKKGA